MNEKRKFKVVYWLRGNRRVAEVMAYSKYDAKRVFYMRYEADDIDHIEEVVE